MATVDIWLAIASQWRPPVTLADGRIFATGLDYAGVTAGLVLAGLTMTPAQWSGVRLMEAAAAAAMNGFAG